jgi:hypothetical protein
MKDHWITEEEASFLLGLAGMDDDQLWLFANATSGHIPECVEQFPPQSTRITIQIGSYFIWFVNSSGLCSSYIALVSESFGTNLVAFIETLEQKHAAASIHRSATDETRRD